MAALLVVFVLLGWAIWFSRPGPARRSDDRPAVGPRTRPDVRPDIRPDIVVSDPPEVRATYCPAPRHLAPWPVASSTRPAMRRLRFPGVPRLTEDDLIAFGLALEAADDVVGELLDRSSWAESPDRADR